MTGASAVQPLSVMALRFSSSLTTMNEPPALLVLPAGGEAGGLEDIVQLLVWHGVGPVSADASPGEDGLHEGH